MGEDRSEKEQDSGADQGDGGSSSEPQADQSSAPEPGTAADETIADVGEPKAESGEPAEG